MIEPQKLIVLVNNGCRNFFSASFSLKPYPGHHNILLFRTEGTSSALNRFETPYNPVKVLHWFNNFWLFLEIKFIRLVISKKKKELNQIHTYISLSVFQGEDNDEMKYQLFRAEWDDYCNPNEKHSQPHWHLTSNQAIEKTFEEYSNTFEDDGFISMLKEVKTKVFDVKKIHFAMNGNWQNDEHHIHKIDDEDKIVKWFQGILNHIRVELEEI